MQALVTAGIAERQTLITMHEMATDTFTRAIERAANKRARPVTPPDEEVERIRQEGIDRYTAGVLELREASHAKKIVEINAVHKVETDKLRAKAAEPINEFRISKHFQQKEAALKQEVQQVNFALEAERKKIKGMEFAQVERMDEKREIKELKQRCADRDRLVVEIDRLNVEKDRRNELFRDMNNSELLGVIDVLKVSPTQLVFMLSHSVDFYATLSLGKARHRGHQIGRRNGCNEADAGCSGEGVGGDEGGDRSAAGVFGG